MGLKNTQNTRELPEVCYVELTPQLAELCLAKNTNNREMKRPLVEKKKSDITTGRFKDYCSSVVVSKNEVLLDGQHTCLAVLETGIPVNVTFHTGREDADWLAFDSGSQRTVGQMLQHEGIKNYNDIGTLARATMIWRETGYPIKAGAGRVKKNFTSTGAVVEYALEHGDELHEAAAAGRHLHGALPAISRCDYGALYLVLGDANLALRDLFFEEVVGGHAANGTATAALRKVYLRLIGKSFDRRPSAIVTLAMTIKVWNHWIDGQSVKQVKWNQSEDFPTIYAPAEEAA